MSTAIWTFVAILATGAATLAVRVVRKYLATRGSRVVICPETGKPVGVKVDAMHAAVTGVLGTPAVRLSACTRWPERQDCAQACLREIEAAPDGCLVRSILDKWYAGKRCGICGEPFGKIDWLEHEPALTADGRATVAWREVAPETLRTTLETHLPVCANCNIAETFRRRFPELVVDRPALS